MKQPTYEKTVRCLGLVLELVGEENRDAIRRWMLDNADVEEIRDSLQVMNYCERALDKITAPAEPTADSGGNDGHRN